MKKLKESIEIIDSKKGDSTIDLVLDTLNKGKQALVFVNSKRSAEKTAEDISKVLKESEKGDELSKNIIKVLSSPTKQCKRLSDCIKKQVAFHHSGLVSKQREIIEEEFLNGNVKIICSTPTLALGIDLPAYRAIIKDIKRFSIRGMEYIPVMEYHQICGRAGRPGKETEGEAIVIVSNEKVKGKVLDRYVKGKPEEILSKLAVEPVLRAYLLSLISSEFINNKKEIVEFFSKTFWAFQYQDIEQLSLMLENNLKDLEEWEFVEVEDINSKREREKNKENQIEENTGKNKKKQNNEFVEASLLDKSNNENMKIKSTLLGKRVAQLYLDPFSAHNIISELRRADKNKSDYFAYLFTIVSTNEMRPYLSIRAGEKERLDILSGEYKDQIKTPDPWEEEYEDFISVFKTCLMLDSWLGEDTEEKILEKFGVRPGELQYKLTNSDWLLYSSQEIARILRLDDAQRVLRELRLRVKYGIKKELLNLLKLKGIGRVRARMLFKNGFKDTSNLRKGDINQISRLIGPTMAKNIKEQLGEKVEISYMDDEKRDKRKDTKNDTRRENNISIEQKETKKIMQHNLPQDMQRVLSDY